MTSTTAEPRKLDFLAAFLTYLLPGLGQVIQGRIGKGLLFFICLYSMFFYGMYLGQWKNVWLPDSRDQAPMQVFGITLPKLAQDVTLRKGFAGQFWIGIAAWPALVQYVNYDPTKEEGPIFHTYQRQPTEVEINDLQRASDKRWDLGWVYTVIAGVLNILVICDALAGPVVKEEEQPPSERPTSAGGAA